MTKTTIWGDMPGGSISNLPAQRMAVNLSTGNGLPNLRKDKVNLMNVNYSMFALCTSETSYKAMLDKVFIRCLGYHVIAVIENEPDNKNVISNTTVQGYLDNLLWAKQVAKGYNIEVMHGGVMFPAAYRIHQDTLGRQEKKELATYMRSRGYFIGGKEAAYNALTELDFCQQNGILGNFHSQQEYVYLSSVIATLRTHCDDMSNNELAVRSSDIKEVAGITEAVRGNLSYAIWFNQDLGKNAKVFTKEQRDVFMSLV